MYKHNQYNVTVFLKVPDQSHVCAMQALSLTYWQNIKLIKQSSTNSPIPMMQAATQPGQPLILNRWLRYSPCYITKHPLVRSLSAQHMKTLSPIHITTSLKDP